ncbi:MAG: polyribonucleotide nucleotidyltransferase [Candidatus Wildermuthbacteria bacterium]|nr:polyribonucleotide nucleotidyltransferase [Candidatus Wildermuthbacteria bacterium]
MADKNTHTITLGKSAISFELTDWAEQANGAVLVRAGDTVVLVTAVMSKQPLENLAFFPLTVEYEERFYAAGRILGSRFMRREGRPSDDAVITARLIDRAIRPLFPKWLNREVQVITTCLSWDAQNDPDIMGLMGASLALSISNIPWQGPVGVVRVGKIEGELILNPTYEERAKSDLDFVLAGALDNGEVAYNMIEAEAQEVPEDIFQQALEFAKPHLSSLIELQQDIVKKSGAKKIPDPEKARDVALEQECGEFLRDKLATALFSGEKKTRMESANEIKRELAYFIESKYPGMNKAGYAKDFFEEELDRAVHRAALKEQKRVDDRKPEETRELSAKVALLPRTHGSGLFLRGQTKTLSLLTLGAPGDQRLLEGMEFIGKKRFMHHYNFPPYAPGEVKQLRGPSRRDLGHGMLAEKALLPVIPTVDQFPYTIRIVTEVISSNGSTSMASVCSSSLALMDAGVPITRPVAGISMGLMLDENGKTHTLLTDIQGPEDHHGDMDFKVAGTTKGITAIQLDVKVRGITAEIFKEALGGAKKTRNHILENVMARTIPEARKELSPLAPRIFVLKINPEKIGLVIGPGGKTINKITDETGVTIDIEDTGEVFITSLDANMGQRALDIVRGIVKEVEAGEEYTGKVTRIMDFGAFVEVLPGKEGLVHISRLANYHVKNVGDIVKVGDIVPVKVVEIDNQGRINLSLKDAREPKQ